VSASVLIIDDNESVREVLSKALGAARYIVAKAADGETGLSMIRSWKPDIVLLDVQMPGMSGTAVFRQLRKIAADIGVIMITSVDSIDTVRETLKLGAFDYLLKPLSIPAVMDTISRAVEKRNLQLEVARYRENLELLVFERTEALQTALNRIEGTYTQTILALGSALETRDVETRAHSWRVAAYTIALCTTIRITDERRLTAIRRGAFLHDIGKIGVPDQILHKNGPLTEQEWVIMRRHPELGVRLLTGIEFLHDSLPLVRNHHEHWDGSGYPDGLAAEAIPIEARLFAVADALDAITSDRPYRKGRSISEARRIIAEGCSTQFDPAAIDALNRMDDSDIQAIQREASEP
jgi:putative two-component system response regulator